MLTVRTLHSSDAAEVVELDDEVVDEVGEVEDEDGSAGTVVVVELTATDVVVEDVVDVDVVRIGSFVVLSRLGVNAAGAPPT